MTKIKNPIKVAVGKKSKRKGRNFERVVAKILDEWWTGGKGEFHVVPCSGGLNWKTKKAITVGDIVGPNDFPFVVSCKNTEIWDFNQLLGNKNKDSTSPLLKWFEEIRNEAEELYNKTGIIKYPVIIFTKKYLPEYIIYSKILNIELDSLKLNMIQWKDYCICKLSDFTKEFCNIDEKIKKILER